VQFEGFSYQSAQVFDFTKIWADKKSLTHEDFNPNTVYNEAFEKWEYFVYWVYVVIAQEL